MKSSIQILALSCLAALVPQLAAAQTTVAPPNITTATPKPLGTSPSIAQILADGFEIKAAFINNGVSYVFLQKTTSAFMCKSGAGASCEKLN